MSGFAHGIVAGGLVVWLTFAVLELWHREWGRAAVSIGIATFQAALLVAII